MKARMAYSKRRTFECPNCRSKNVDTRTEAEKFTYGSGDASTKLEAYVPVRKCNDCGFEYTDSKAEDLRHEAVCRHLNVMPPAKIIALRVKYNLSREEFAQRSRIGESFLERWESGELIQSAAYDDYLYLLTFPENMERLKERRS